MIYIKHYGVKGMKWGVRRYQNKDGSLTPEGRKRLKLNEYDNNHAVDTILKKGTKVNRVVSTNRFDEFNDSVDRGIANGKLSIKQILDDEKKRDLKYVSVENVKNSGRVNGKDFYLYWLTDGGYDPDGAIVTNYVLKDDAKIASGKKVVDALLNEVGNLTITQLLQSNDDIYKLTSKYTRNKELFNTINKKFQDEGYDGIEDINDPDTDMPVILFNSSQKIGNPVSIQKSRDTVNEIVKRMERRRRINV